MNISLKLNIVNTQIQFNWIIFNMGRKDNEREGHSQDHWRWITEAEHDTAAVLRVDRDTVIRILGLAQRFNAEGWPQHGGYSNIQTMNDVYRHLAAQDKNADITKMLQYFTTAQ